MACQDTLFDGIANATAMLSDGEGWAPVSNLDIFFSRMYSFYYERGFSVIAAKRITNLVYVVVCVLPVVVVVSRQRQPPEPVVA